MTAYPILVYANLYLTVVRTNDYIGKLRHSNRITMTTHSADIRIPAGVDLERFSRLKINAAALHKTEFYINCKYSRVRGLTQLRNPCR